MKNHYRLLSNGHLYKIQHRFLWFFWRDYRVQLAYGGSYEVRFFKDKSVAEKTMEDLELEHLVRVTKYKEITSVRTTNLWKLLNKDKK